MKRAAWIIAIGFLALGLAAGCKSAPDVPIEPEKPVPISTLFVQPSPAPTSETPTPTDTPAPTVSPAPEEEAGWLRTRHDELKSSILLYHLEQSEEQAEREIKRMQIDPDKPMVALTFDDGPAPGVTDKILDVLEENNARATFFVCGWRLDKEKNKDILLRAASLGCEIGNHTWSHEKLVVQNYVSVRYEIENTNKAIEGIIGIKPRCFRPPGGVNTYEATAVTRDNGMVIVLWAQSGNVHESDPKKIAQNVQKQIVNGKELHDGDIVLLHDTPHCMVDAVKIIVPMLQEQGYQLVTVWELLNSAGKAPTPGELYDRR